MTMDGVVKEPSEVCQKLSSADKGVNCNICLSCEHNPLMYGDFYRLKNITVHYFCLLFASKLVQNGQDTEGILGFLLENIKEEIKRGKRLRCRYCRKNGATIGCVVKTCKLTFHLPCGLKEGSLHQFFDSFKSYCAAHRPQQKVNGRVINSDSGVICPICYEDVATIVSNDTLWAPCCRKRWFHRFCLQKLAVSSGYFFKCPVCNNMKIFSQEMKKMGIYIPEMDASWELVPNAYAELLHVHNICDSDPCECPEGRKFTASVGSWRLLRCNACGSEGTHVACARLKIGVASNLWRCAHCVTTLDRNETVDESPKTTNSRLDAKDDDNRDNNDARSSCSSSSSSSPSLSVRSPAYAAKRRKIEDGGCISGDSSSDGNEHIDVVGFDDPPELSKEPVHNTYTNGKVKEDLSNNAAIVIIDDSSDESDVEVLNFIPAAKSQTLFQTSSRSPLLENILNAGVKRELCTKEGKKIMVHPVQATDGKEHNECATLGGVQVKPTINSSPSKYTLNITTPEPTFHSNQGSEPVSLRLGSQISLFPVSTQPSHSAAKLPAFKDVNITCISSNGNASPRVNIVNNCAIGSSDTSTSFPPIRNENRSPPCEATSIEQPSSTCDIKIENVRHSNELFTSNKPDQEQEFGETNGVQPSSAIFPMYPFVSEHQQVVYYPVTTSDGRSAVQAMVPLQSLPLQLIQQQPKQHKVPQSSAPDVVTID